MIMIMIMIIIIIISIQLAPVVKRLDCTIQGKSAINYNNY